MYNVESFIIVDELIILYKGRYGNSYLPSLLDLE